MSEKQVQKVETYNFDATPIDVTVTQSVTGKIGFEVKVRGDTPSETSKEAIRLFEELRKLYGGETK